MTESQNIKLIPLTKGKFAIVDAEDFERVSRYKWHANNTQKKFFYAVREINSGIRIQMSNFIIGAQKGTIVDHINGDKLDNRKNNLRITNTFGNAQNKGKAKNTTSKYKGVCFEKSTGKWKAQIKPNRKVISLGRFSNEKDAAMAYDSAAISFFERFALLNKNLFPNDFYNRR